MGSVDAKGMGAGDIQGAVEGGWVGYVVADGFHYARAHFNPITLPGNFFFSGGRFNREQLKGDVNRPGSTENLEAGFQAGFGGVRDIKVKRDFFRSFNGDGSGVRRFNFVGVIKNCKGKKGLERVEGEVTVVTLCLDDIARYLRMYGSSLNRNQIRDIYIKLQGFEQIFNSMKKLGEFYTRKEQIDSKGFIARLALKNRIKIPVAENKKNDEKK